MKIARKKKNNNLRFPFDRPVAVGKVSMETSKSETKDREED